MARTIGIGIQSFEKIIQNQYLYIDKTGFIKEWWESGDEVTMITRPRRFGKTLNMNMLERFLSIQYAGQGEVFEGLSIWKEEKYRMLQGTLSVIFLSFADIKANTFAMAKEKICPAIFPGIMTERLSSCWMSMTHRCRKPGCTVTGRKW